MIVIIRFIQIIMATVVTSAVSVTLQFGGVAHAQHLDIQERLRYIDFTGRDLKAVFREIKSYSRKQNHEGDFWAHTQLIYRPSIEHGIEGATCYVERFTIHVDIEYRMPRWTNKKRAPRNHRVLWDKVFANAWRHERVHGEIAKATGAELVSVISEMDRTANCDTYLSVAQATVSRFINSTTAQEDFHEYEQKNGDSSGFDIAAAVRRDRERFNLMENSGGVSDYN